MICEKCGRDIGKHLLNGNCPIGMTLEISASALERVHRTGHPRLLKNVLENKLDGGVFTEIHIDRLTVEGEA